MYPPPSRNSSAGAAARRGGGSCPSPSSCGGRHAAAHARCASSGQGAGRPRRARRAGSLRFLLPRRQPPLPRLERRRLSLSPISKKKKTAKDAPTRARRASRRRRPGAGRRARCGCRCRRRRACGRASGGLSSFFTPFFFVFLGFETVSFPFFLFVPSRPPPSHSPFSRRSLSYRRRGPWSWRAPASDTR